MAKALDFSNRFNGRAAAYAKSRPGYPTQIIDVLKTEIGFDQNKIVADIGSGTGLLSKLFLLNGNRVFGVEPNKEMRSLAEQSLSRFPNFVCVDGRAEGTNLSDRAVDLVTVGQALHWFDRQAALREFARILRNKGDVCIVYNDRNLTDSFMKGYEAIVTRHARDRASVPKVDHEYLAKFFRGGEYKKSVLRNEQLLDFEGLLGRIASASYMPNITDVEGFEAVKNDAAGLFESNARMGKVRLLYDTTIFLGQVQT